MVDLTVRERGVEHLGVHFVNCCKRPVLFKEEDAGSASKGVEAGEGLRRVEVCHHFRPAHLVVAQGVFLDGNERIGQQVRFFGALVTEHKVNAVGGVLAVAVGVENGVFVYPGKGIEVAVGQGVSPHLHVAAEHLHVPGAPDEAHLCGVLGGRKGVLRHCKGVGRRVRNDGGRVGGHSHGIGGYSQGVGRCSQGICGRCQRVGGYGQCVCGRREGVGGCVTTHLIGGLGGGRRSGSARSAGPTRSRRLAGLARSIRPAGAALALLGGILAVGVVFHGVGSGFCGSFGRLAPVLHDGISGEVLLPLFRVFDPGFRDLELLVGAVHKDIGPKIQGIRLLAFLLNHGHYCGLPLEGGLLKGIRPLQEARQDVHVLDGVHNFHLTKQFHVVEGPVVVGRI